MERELEIFGLYLSEHPITEIKAHYPNTISIDEIPKYFDKRISTIVYIDKVKEITTKKNQKMAFLVGSDEISTIDLTLFSNLYEENKDLEKGNIVLVTGKVEKRFDKYQLIVQKIDKLK